MSLDLQAGLFVFKKDWYVKNESFTIQRDGLVVIAEVPVVADTFEIAVEKAKALKVSDFVTVKGEHMDNSLRLVSISVPDSWDTD